MSSAPHIIHNVRSFGAFSGYKHNLNKSELNPVNDSAHQIQHNVFPFKWSMNNFKYLGILKLDDLRHRCVHQWLVPQQAPMAFRPQLLVTASAIGALNMVHLDSMSLTSPGTRGKLFWR